MNNSFHKQAIRGGAAFLTVGLLVMSTANAATITMKASDAFGKSSFNSGLNWTGGAAPVVGKTYSTNGFSLRTPADANSYTFVGDSLTVDAEGGLQFKGKDSTGAAIITIGSLLLDGGTLAALDKFTYNLAGGVSVTANGGTINAQDGNLYVNSLVSGSGPLSVIDSNGSTNGSRTVFFSNGSNTYNGTITVDGSFDLTSVGNLNFMIGASGVNNSVTGTGAATFDGIFDFDVSAATGSGSWTIVDTLTKSFSGTFTVAGWTDNGDNTWSSGNYTFSELSGTLTAAAIPEPSTFAMLAGALALGLAAIGRRRNA